MDPNLLGMCRQGIDNHGFFVLKNVISQDLLSYILSIAEIEKNLNLDKTIVSEKDTDVSKLSNVPGNSEYEYGSLKSDGLFPLITEIYRDVTKRNLVPSFSYYRTYYKNSSLDRHLDRPSCQYSITTPIGSYNNESWDIYIKSLYGQEHSVSLSAGDVLFYRGEICEHWREPLDNEWSTHVFMHWIDFDQPDYKQYYLDGRDSLGFEWNKKFNKVLGI